MFSSPRAQAAHQQRQEPHRERQRAQRRRDRALDERQQAAVGLDHRRDEVVLEHATQHDTEYRRRDRHAVLLRHLDNPALRLMSVMDHTPGQRQWKNTQLYRDFHADACQASSS